MSIKAFCKRWQEPFIWLPMCVIALAAAHWLLPQLDPSAGIDGLGFLYGVATFALAFSVASFLAWLSQVAYGIELTEDQEHALILDGTWRSLLVLWMPWLQWFAVFAIVIAAMS